MSHDVLMYMVLPAWVALLVFGAAHFYRTECKRPMPGCTRTQATRNTNCNTNQH
jgi:hypothetical protein